MIGDITAFFGRLKVIELFLSFIFASAIVQLVTSVIGDLVVGPITRGGSGNHSSLGGLTLVVSGRDFEFTYPLIHALTLLGVTLLAIVLIRRSAATLWDERAVRECPLCLSEVPVEATVCAYCARDIA
jgi:large conductance mechanosensitive channel